MKKNFLGKTIALLTLVCVMLSSIPAFAYVHTAEDGGINTYTLNPTTAFNTNTKFNDVEAYKDSAGNEYVYVMAISGDKGVYTFKRNEIVGESATTVTYDVVGSVINNYQKDLTYNTLDIVGNTLWMVNQKNTTANPTVINYDLSNPASPTRASGDNQKIFTFDKANGKLLDFKITDSKVYGLSEKAFGVIGFSNKGNESGVCTTYTFENSTLLPGIASEFVGSIEVLNGYIYICGQEIDADSNNVLCVWALKETENGLEYLGKKEYLTTANAVTTADSIIVNDTLYVSANAGDYEAGIFAIDLTVQDEFANAVSKHYCGNVGASDAFRIKKGYKMDTDGRYLFVSDTAGLTIFDTIGGVDILAVGGDKDNMKGTNIALSDGRIYLTSSATANTGLKVWDYEIYNERDDVIGYAVLGNNVAATGTITGSTAADLTKNRASVTAADGEFGYSGTSDGWSGHRVWALKNDSNVTTTYNVTSLTTCKKSLYLQARLRSHTAKVSVNVNGADVYSVDEITSDAAELKLTDIYLCDVNLNKGANTITIKIEGVAGADQTATEDGIQVGGIALSYAAIDDTAGLSLGKTEFLTTPVAGATVKARSNCWQTSVTPTYGTVKVIYATYDVEGSMIDTFYDDLTMSELFERKYIDIDVDVTSDTYEIRRFVFSDFETIYPINDCETISIAQ